MAISFPRALGDAEETVSRLVQGKPCREVRSKVIAMIDIAQTHVRLHIVSVKHVSNKVYNLELAKS